MENRPIVFMDSDIPSIYFPVGLPIDGGTCEFATKVCLEHCPSGGAVNEHERYALQYFINHTSKEVFAKIVLDFGELADRPYNAKMLQWYTWGDCPSKLTQKVYEIILMLCGEGIPQYGFTRNERLWELVPQKDRLNIGLSLDNLDLAIHKSLESGKMTACPDYEAAYARMIFNGQIQATCNGWWCITKSETRNSDCTKCLAYGEGCYPWGGSQTL